MYFFFFETPDKTCLYACALLYVHAPVRKKVDSKTIACKKTNSKKIRNSPPSVFSKIQKTLSQHSNSESWI